MEAMQKRFHSLKYGRLQANIDGFLRRQDSSIDLQFFTFGSSMKETSSGFGGKAPSKKG
jgi:hypothetical protein